MQYIHNSRGDMTYKQFILYIYILEGLMAKKGFWRCGSTRLWDEAKADWGGGVTQYGIYGDRGI